MGDSYREILVKREKTLMDQVKKISLIGITVLLFVSGIFVSPILIFPALIFALICYFFLPAFDLEYEYLYVNGELDIDKIMGKQKRKKCAGYDMNLLEIMAPSGSHELDSFRNKKDLKVRDFTSRRPDVPSYTLIFNLEKGQELVKLELDEDIVGDIRRIAPRKVYRQ